jgi:hypothetical protein
MNRWRVREDRGSKEKDRCPLTVLLERTDTSVWEGCIMLILALENVSISDSF